MNTSDLERAIANCKKFFVSPRTGRAVYEYDDIRAELALLKVAGLEKMSNAMIGRVIAKLGGFVLDQCNAGGEKRSTVQATPERIEKLRQQVKLYVSKPSKGHNNTNNPLFHAQRAKFGRKARF
jgi:hypothetical protein